MDGDHLVFDNFLPPILTQVPPGLLDHLTFLLFHKMQAQELSESLSESLFEEGKRHSV